MKKPEAILFDVGDTLCTLDRFDTLAGNRRCCELAIDDHGLTAGEVQQAADSINAMIGPLRESSSLEHGAGEFQKLLYDYLGFEFPISGSELEEEFWDAAVRYAPEIGVWDALTWLKSEGIQLGVVSNFAFSGSILRAELARHRILTFFNPVIASSEYGIRKPNTLIFKLAARMLGFPPSEIWFVGDRLEYDVAGAKAAGMISVWYNRHGREPGAITPDLTFTRWSEFQCLL